MLALFANRGAGNLRIRWLIGLAGLATGCGDPIDVDSGAPEPVTAPDTVSVSGRITFDHVPVMSAMGTGLDYGATAARPARGVTVELFAADLSAGTAIADDEGRYRLDAPRESDVSLRVRAELRGEDANPLAQVLDNTRDGAMHTMEGAPFRTGEADHVRDLHAASGWTGTGYGEPRAAAAFAILDVVYEAMQWVRAVDEEVAFLPLDLFWSPDNRGIVRQDGEPEYASGRIGGTHYRRAGPDEPRSPAIYLVGAQNEDTDEYDRSVIAHEWMHYLLDTQSRDDSIGGRHALGEQLDLRVAFSEGTATALAAAMLGETETRYTLGPQQAHGGGWSVERFVPPRPGWFSEGSVMAIVYDLLDPANDDPLAFGFAEVYDVLVNEVRQTPALTSVFAFVDALKCRHPARAGEIDALLAGHRIGPVVDAYGSTESNAGYPPGEDTLPVFAKLTVNAAAANVCSTAAFMGMQAQGNALGVWRLVRFASPGAGVTVSAIPTSAPRASRPDPSIRLYGMGLVGEFQGTPGVACTPDRLEACAGRVSVPLPGGREQYVVAVAEAANASRRDDVQPNGRTCFDVTVTSP